MPWADKDRNHSFVKEGRDNDKNQPIGFEGEPVKKAMAVKMLNEMYPSYVGQDFIKFRSII